MQKKNKKKLYCPNPIFLKLKTILTATMYELVQWHFSNLTGKMKKKITQNGCQKNCNC